jgi:1-acyl-sn-glycerol-3-phosphate acyltransferase
MLVANHSSGAIFEVLLLHRSFRMHFGDRPAGGLVHRVAWEWPFRLVPFLEWMGGVFAHPTAARRALESGKSLLVFPGGELDSSRSFFARDRVIFGGRAGFARIAREAGVPIVPIAISGAHACYFVLPGGPFWARALGLRRLFGAKAAPMTLGFLATLLSLPVAAASLGHLWWLPLALYAQCVWPLPSRILAEVGEPMLPRPDESDAAFAERVRAALEKRLTLLRDERATPWG